MKRTDNNTTLLAILAVVLLLVGMSVAGHFAQEEEDSYRAPRHDNVSVYISDDGRK